MGIYAFPQQAGVKFRGVNLNPRTTDVDWEIANGPSSYGRMAYQWGAADVSDPWTNHLKPEIDALHGIGVNLVRLGFAVELRYGDLAHGISAHLTLGQFQAIMAQIANYTASLGMWFYPMALAAQHLNYANTSLSVSQANTEAYIAECLDYLDSFPNVVGFDVVQEIDAGGTGTFTYTHLADWLTAAAAVTSKPITCSLNGALSSTDLDWTRAAPIVTAGATFADFHVYYTPVASDIWPIMYNGPGGLSVRGIADTPLIIGEMGILNDAGSSAVSARYAIMAGAWWGGGVRLQALLAWSTNDFGAAGTYDYGVLDAAFAPRSVQCTALQTIPTSVLPYDGAEDAFAVVEAPPTEIDRTTTSIDLSWSAAVGGSGTITYTPQYATVDANGFPTQAWQSASTTTGTTATISGLDNVRYAVRIKSSGAPEGGGSAGLTYSSWLVSELVASGSGRFSSVFAGVVR